MPSTPQPERGSPAAALLRLLLVAVFAAASWWLIEWGVAVGHLVPWECWGGECSTNDPRSLLPIAGIICNVVLAVLLLKPARAFGFGLAALVGTLAALSGWNKAITEGGVDPASVLTEQRIVTAAAALTALIALLGLLSELKTTGYGARLLGAKRVPAVLVDYGAAEGDFGRINAKDAAALGFGTAYLTFTDNGRRHRVKVRAREQWVGHPLFAVFRETRPERAKIALPWIRSFPAPERPEPDAAPAAAASDTFVAELERLAALRAEGHLTQEEFDAAKRRLLGN
ncbi:SHOCT domain-containing protein [Glycomyces sp. NPDC047369]